jgi:hypothetical protein
MRAPARAPPAGLHPTCLRVLFDNEAIVHVVVVSMPR